MSELTSCNYCNLRGIKSRTLKGEKITILSDATWGMGGVNVYRHPRSVKIQKLSYKARQKYFVSWFMQLTTHCCC